MSTEKNERCLAIFLRGMRGEKITVTELANEYGVSAKSIARDISEIRCFLAENRDLTGHAELVYDRSAKCYTRCDKGADREPRIQQAGVTGDNREAPQVHFHQG